MRSRSNIRRNVTMKITKFNQSCLLIETKNKRILVDPGNIGYSENLLNDWKDIDYIFEDGIFIFESKQQYVLGGDLLKIENLIKSKFDLEVANIKIIGEGYDSKAYLINDEYIFKLKISSNKKKGYKKEKAVLDFLNRNLRTTIKIPQIDFIYIDNELSIMGYKKINGTFLTPDIYKEMNVKQQEILKKDIAKFLKDMHNLDYAEIKEYVIDNKQNCLEEYEKKKKTIYNDLTEKEKKYIEKFFERLNNTTIFDDKKC